MAQKKAQSKKSTKKSSKSSKSAAKKNSTKAKKLEKLTVVELPKDEAQDIPEDTSHAQVIDNPGFFSKCKQRLGAMKKWQIAAVAAVLLLVVMPAVLYAIPATRSSVFNVSNSTDVSILVVDADTMQPLNAAFVELAGSEAVLTGQDGVVIFEEVPHGPAELVIYKGVYDTLVVNVEVTSDSTQFGPYELVPTGVPVTVRAVDWLTGETVTNFTLTGPDGETMVMSDEEGVAVLNVPQNVDTETYSVTSDGYNDSEVIANIVSGPDEEVVNLVQSGRHYFISNRGGDIGFYSSNYDGSDDQQLIDTKEDDQISYRAVPNTSNTYAVLLPSERGGDFDQLFIAKVEESSFESVDDAIGQDVSFHIQAVDEQRVVYIVHYDDDDRDDHYKLKTYEFSTGELTTVFESPDHFDLVYASDYDEVYISENKQVNFAWSRTFFKVNLNDDTRTVLLPNTQVWSLRVPYEEPDKLLYYVSSYNHDPGTQPGYYLRDLADNSQVEFLGLDYPDFEEPDEVPDSEKGLASPEGTNRVWIETRDGKGKLILNESKNIISGDVLELSASTIIRWISETQLTVAGSDGIESADYIVDIETGNYRKITNTYQRQFYGHGHGF